MMRKIALAFVVVLSFTTLTANAQYFGRNKVQWEHFNFKVLKTEHFDIYYYDREADVVNDIGRQAERWYERLSRIFNHSFTRKPIVIYANSADFHQTTTTPELIGEGTGGFTDPFMNRVVLPLTGDYSENDHVIGHELVHVFQFDVASSMVNNRRRFNLEMMPLWIVEGMAEYLSKGRIDPLTAMWIRDATVHDRLPDIRKLTRDPRYFPYRYGEALMAYIGGRFGDDAVIRYFLAAGTSDPETAFERSLGINAKQIFTDWNESAREMYNPIIKDRPANLGTPLIGGERKKGARGVLNVGPAYSPDGQYIALLSTRNIFDIDLFLAEASTGKIIRRLVGVDRNAHFESLRFIDSAGSWSPDSKHLAFIVFEKGDNYIGIVDVDSKHIEEVRVPGVDAIQNVAWSPDGKSIAIAGQETGVSDLFLFDLDSKQVRRLTSDKFADLQPAWSPDGRTIAFVSDRGGEASLEQLRFSGHHIATIDVGSREIKVLPLFSNALNINPQYAPDGQSIYFIANPEGVADIFRYYFADSRVARVTHVQTGVSGITDLAPALTVSARTGDIAFSLFEDDNYNIYKLPANTGALTMASTTAPASAVAGQLPPLRGTGSTITAYLQNPTEGLLPLGTTFPESSYKPSLHLAYLGPPTIGVAVGSYGAGAGGSVSAYFSDILGEHNVGLTFQGGGSSGIGTVGDQISGEVFYLNQKHRFNWGADLVHLPYISAFTGVTQEQINLNGQVVVADVVEQQRDIQRFDDFSLITQYPFSQTRRVEFSGGLQHQSVKSEVERVFIVGDTIVDRTIERLGDPLSLNLAHGSAAFVGDSSIFGFVSPIRGTRYRYEGQVLTGDLHFETALADWRKYFFLNPITFAVRGIHYGRYGADAEDPRISQLYLGRSEQVRGYEIDSISASECGNVANRCPVFERLVGSKIAVANAEVRIPLFGTKEFGLLSGFIPTELVGFADAGAAWTANESAKIKFQTNTNERVPVVSAGVAVRMLLSYIPIELYYAHPFQRPDKNWVFGFNITPGW
jgi:Tol biopolymer transport system component